MIRRLWNALMTPHTLRERVQRRLQPGRLLFPDRSWPLTPAFCPCDVHFGEYLRERDIRHRSIFHLGTGGHHIVGKLNCEAGLANEILGLTLSPQENAQYVAAVIRNPLLGRHYKVLFADLYSLSAAGLPAFDIVTLFHLCEFADRRSAGRRMDDARVLDLFLSKLAPGGLMVFYPGSCGYSQAQPLIAQVTGDRRLSPVEQYKSLAIFRGAAGPRASPVG